MPYRVVKKDVVMEGIPSHNRAHKVGNFYYLYRFNGKTWTPDGATRDKQEVRRFLDGSV